MTLSKPSYGSLWLRQSHDPGPINSLLGAKRVNMRLQVTTIVSKAARFKTRILFDTDRQGSWGQLLAQESRRKGYESDHTTTTTTKKKKKKSGQMKGNIFMTCRKYRLLRVQVKDIFHVNIQNTVVQTAACARRIKSCAFFVTAAAHAKTSEKEFTCNMFCRRYLCNFLCIVLNVFHFGQKEKVTLNQQICVVHVSFFFIHTFFHIANFLSFPLILRKIKSNRKLMSMSLQVCQLLYQKAN